jgi:hypothetical protein
MLVKCPVRALVVIPVGRSCCAYCEKFVQPIRCHKTFVARAEQPFLNCHFYQRRQVGFCRFQAAIDSFPFFPQQKDGFVMMQQG